jgi:hypothetical protein
MADRQEYRAERSSFKARGILLRVIGAVLALPLWVTQFLLVLLLPFGRVFVAFPLALATIGGLGAGVYLGFHHAWGDAARAVVVGVVASAALTGFTHVAEKVDPDFSRPRPAPPWWWYF